VYGSILPSSCRLRPSALSSALVFLRDLQPPSTAMAAELPPSRFKTMSSLASLRRLMGWQAPGLACKVKSGAASLANMWPGDFVFFTAYALAGLVPPLSSFFLMLLEYYGLQLQHLSPNSIALVVIFVHLCEMYVGVRPSVRLFRCFFVLKAVSTHPLLIIGHYFQRRTPGHARYIAPISPGRWERWREDWALVQVDAHDRFALPVGGLTLDCTEWGKDPVLEPGFDPVLDRIQYLAENGLTSLMVLHDFLSKRLAPLQDRSHHPAGIYTGVNDIMQLDRRPGSSLCDTLLAASLKALTMDQPSTELMMPAAGCEPLCVNQATRIALLAIMPTLDDVDIAPVHRATSPAAWSSPGSAVWVAPLVVMATEVSRQAAVRQVAVVAPRWVVKGAPPVVPARMSLCRSGCGNSLAPGRQCTMRRPRLTRRPQTRGPWRRPWRSGLWRRPRQRSLWRRGPRRRQRLSRPRELPRARRPPARRRQ
jgi:hypothetical protein